MSSPIRNVYRQPYEYLSACTYAVGAGAVLWRAPELLLSQPVALGAACGLAWLAAWRYYEGRRIAKFRRQVRVVDPYALYPEQTPWSHKSVFLGQGFEWTVTHTQRMFLLAKEENQTLTRMGRAYKWARGVERDPHGSAWLQRLVGRDSRWNPLRPLPPVGGLPALHGVEIDEEDIWTDLVELNNHMMVYGTTRVGKTRLAQILIEQDIKRGDVVVVFDPKGDVDLLLGMYSAAMRAGRADDFLLFHLGFADISARYNPIGNFEQVTEVASRATGPLPEEGQSAAFKAFAWRYVNVIARAMSAVGERPDYTSIYEYGVAIDKLAGKYLRLWLNQNKPGWEADFSAIPTREDKEIVAKAEKNSRDVEVLLLMAHFKRMGWQDAVADALASILANDRTYFEKLVNSLYPLLEKLTTGSLAKLVSPDYADTADPRPILDWTAVINRGGIVYCGFDALSNRDVAEAVSASMLADITSTFGRLYKHGSGYGMPTPEPRRRVRMHADELNELIGPEFIQAANKAGGAGLFITGYSQTAQDIEVKVGSPAKADQLAGNLNSIVMLRVVNMETAEKLTDRLGDVRVATPMIASGVADMNDLSDGGDFSSRNEDRISMEKVPLLDPSWLMHLPKGQAFALLEGTRLVKLRLPLPLAHEDDERIPVDWASMLTHMRDQYADYLARTPDFDLTIEGSV